MKTGLGASNDRLGLSVCVAATAHRPAKVQKAAFFCIRGRRLVCLADFGCAYLFFTKPFGYIFYHNADAVLRYVEVILIGQ